MISQKKKTKKKYRYLINYVAVVRIRNICTNLVNVIMGIVN